MAALAVNDNYDIDSPPDAVGVTVVGDVIADQSAFRRNKIPPSDPTGDREPALPDQVRDGRAALEDDAAIGALVVANKRGRHPEFSPETRSSCRTSVARPCARFAPPGSTRPRRRSRS
jgi:hypothetical protein